MFWNLTGRAKSSEDTSSVVSILNIQKHECKSSNFKIEGIEDNLNRLLVKNIEQYTNVIDKKDSMGSCFQFNQTS